MRLQPETLSGTGHPAFLGHRQQHAHCTASTALTFEPRGENEKAGLTVFQNESHYYFLCLSMEKDKPALQLWKSTGSKTPERSLLLLKSLPLKKSALTSEFGLRITAAGGSYAFYYAEKKDKWKLLIDGVDGPFLSTRIAGGFVGCFFGLHATSLGQRSVSSANYHWFEYNGN